MEIDPNVLLAQELAKPMPDQGIIDLLLSMIYPPDGDPAEDMVTECLKIGGLELTDTQN